MARLETSFGEQLLGAFRVKANWCECLAQFILRARPDHADGGRAKATENTLGYSFAINSEIEGLANFRVGHRALQHHFHVDGEHAWGIDYLRILQRVDGGHGLWWHALDDVGCACFKKRHA